MDFNEQYEQKERNRERGKMREKKERTWTKVGEKNTLVSCNFSRVASRNGTYFTC